MCDRRSCSVQTLKRLPYYLNFLREIEEELVTASMIASECELHEVQVRKDLAAVSQRGGRPRRGFDRAELLRDLEHFLGYANTEDALIVGVGHLGQALIHYRGLADYGMRIAVGFDRRSDVGRIGNVPIFSMEKLASLIRRLHLKMAIVAVPPEAAQEVCDRLVQAGIVAIWNFSPIRLRVPEDVLVQNENMESSLALISNYLAQRTESMAIQ